MDTLEAYSDSEDSWSPSEYQKAKIPRDLRAEVWEASNPQQTQAQCWVGCGAQITPFNFHCGHIRAEKHGGLLQLNNLRPVCKRCNSSMGEHHMFNFIAAHGFRKVPGFPRKLGPQWGPQTKLEYGYYSCAESVPQAVKRRVWFDIGQTQTQCALSYCSKSALIFESRYAFVSEYGKGTITNVKPVCSGCYRRLKGRSTIADLEDFDKFFGELSELSAPPKRKRLPTQERKHKRLRTGI